MPSMLCATYFMAISDEILRKVFAYLDAVTLNMMPAVRIGWRYCSADAGIAGDCWRRLCVSSYPSTVELKERQAGAVHVSLYTHSP